jgi:hypothetical protein
MEKFVIFWTHPILGCGTVNWGGNAPVDEGRDGTSFVGTREECLSLIDNEVNGQLTVFLVPEHGGNGIPVER